MAEGQVYVLYDIGYRNAYDLLCRVNRTKELIRKARKE